MVTPRQNRKILDFIAQIQWTSPWFRRQQGLVTWRAWSSLLHIIYVDFNFLSWVAAIPASLLISNHSLFLQSPSHFGTSSLRTLRERRRLPEQGRRSLDTIMSWSSLQKYPILKTFRLGKSPARGRSPSEWHFSVHPDIGHHTTEIIKIAIRI